MREIVKATESNVTKREACLGDVISASSAKAKANSNSVSFVYLSLKRFMVLKAAGN